MTTLFACIRAFVVGLFWAVFGISGILGIVVIFVFGLIGMVFPTMKLAYFVKERLPRLWDFGFRIGWLRDLVSTLVVRYFGGLTAPRPHAMTMIADYPTWHGFQDRTVTARHLPPSAAFEDKFAQTPKPAIDALVALALRPNDGREAMVPDARSSLLFASFAQWFTDSFLRTSHGLTFDENGVVLKMKDDRLTRIKARVQRNESNHEIDLCQIYGMSEAITSTLRVQTDQEGFDPRDIGCLRYFRASDGEFPMRLLSKAPGDAHEKLDIHSDFVATQNEPLLRAIFENAGRVPQGYESLFACGLEHGNSTIGNSLFNVIFLRHHNWVARKISAAEPLWDDEQVFQTARNTMIVLLLKVVICDYVRHISPLDLPLNLPKGIGDGQNWYRPNRIHIEFNLLYRWHGLVPDYFDFLPKQDSQSDHFTQFRHNNGWLLETGVAGAIDAFSRTQAGKMVLGNTPVALAPVKKDTMHLMRDAKLTSYNDYRACFGLPRATSFEDITGEAELSAKLSALYNDDPDALEWYIGMTAEKHGHNMIMGDLMYNMVAHDAFTHVLTNPLLAEGVYNEETFGVTGFEIINSTHSLTDMIARVAPLEDDQYLGFRVKTQEKGGGDVR